MLALFKDDWVPFVCGTDVSIELSSTKVPIRTKGDGHWKKYTYQDLSWTVTLSGLLTFDEDMWTGWDMLDNQFNFSHVLARVSFDDGEGNIRTVQGYMMIETSTLSYSPGNLVKDDFQLQGNGRLDMFDGLIPCPSTIDSITVTGQTAADGIIHIDYTFTGPVYQVKYRIDDTGEYVYATAGVIIDVPGLANGDHSVEVIPVCQNGFEGTGSVQSFIVTNALTCSSSIDDITVNGTSLVITNTHSGPATQMRYRLDGGAWINALIDDTISIAMISPGNHTIEEVPICSNGVAGTGFTRAFTITVQPALSVINWSLTVADEPTQNLAIYVNGVLYVITNLSESGTFTAPVGASVRAVLYGRTNQVIRHNRLQVVDSTTSTTLYDHTETYSFLFGTVTDQFIFTTNGDEYTITGTIT